MSEFIHRYNNNSLVMGTGRNKPRIHKKTFGAFVFNYIRDETPKQVGWTWAYLPYKNAHTVDKNKCDTLKIHGQGNGIAK